MSNDMMRSMFEKKLCRNACSVSTWCGIQQEWHFATIYIYITCNLSLAVKSTRWVDFIHQSSQLSFFSTVLTCSIANILQIFHWVFYFVPAYLLRTYLSPLVILCSVSTKWQRCWGKNMHKLRQVNWSGWTCFMVTLCQKD